MTPQPKIDRSILKSGEYDKRDYSFVFTGDYHSKKLEANKKYYQRRKKEHKD